MTREEIMQMQPTALGNAARNRLSCDERVRSLGANTLLDEVLFDRMRQEHGYAMVEAWASIDGKPGVFQARYGFGESGGMMPGNTADQAINRAFVLSQQEA